MSTVLSEISLYFPNKIIICWNVNDIVQVAASPLRIAYYNARTTS